MTQTPQETPPKEAMTEKEYAELHPEGEPEVIDVTAWGWTVEDINHAAGVHDKD
jgi:hypothetical protein